MSLPKERRTPPSITQRLLRVATSIVAAGAVVLMGLTLAGLGARWWWRLEQACHFRVQYGALLLLASMVLFAARRRPLATLALMAAMINVGFVAPIYWPAREVPATHPPIRVLAFNVLGKNTQHDRVVRYLREQSADLVLLMEVNDAWASTVANLKDLYPQQHVVARDDNFGIALLSRVAWRNIATLELGEANVPSIVAQFDFPPGACTLIGTHPLPPGSHRLAELRNEQLHELAQLAHQLPGPVVLAGDLNTTSYSPYFSDLLSSSGLRDSRQGRGIQASWGPLPLFEIAIDHCLVSADVAVLERRVGPHLGSDHRPVLVELGFTQANREVLPPR